MEEKYSLSTSEIVRFTNILKIRGFKSPILEDIADVEINTLADGVKYCATKNPLFLHLDSDDEALSNGVILNRDSRFFSPSIDICHKDNCNFIADCWYSILLDPLSTNIQWLNEIKFNILNFLLTKNLWGFILFYLPKLTQWGTLEGWYKDLLFMEKTGKRVQLEGLELNECFPWPLSRVLWKRKRYGIVILRNE